MAQFRFPNFGVIGNPQIWVTAFTIALVASLETLLCVEATDKIDPLKRVTPTNRELLAQGIGNIFSSFIQAVGRNPAARSEVFTMTMLGFALVEAIALFALVIALVILFG